MRKIQAAGLALAVCMCAGIAFFAMQGDDERVSSVVAASSSMPSTHAADVSVPANLSIGAPQPFALNAAVARNAVRDGELRVALADGTTYPVHIERHYTDKSGHWNVVGRADTQRGAQPMVLTFGPRAVFGTLPTPDGTLLRVVTQPRGKIAIAPAGGSLPPGVDPDDANDVIVPRIDATQGKRPVFASAAAQKDRLTPPDAPIVYPPVDTTPVDIDILVAYTPEQVALRGDVEAVQAEIANLIAVTNQAHIDSGSRVRFVQSGTREFANGANPSPNLAVSAFAIDESIRNARGDLSILLRPYPDNGTLCGMAFLTSYGLAGTLAYAQQGFALASADGVCSPYVFAHQLGHGLGAMHEREASTMTDGMLQTGAYYFSYATRTPAFATLMSEASEQPWVPYFSNPANATCNGQACGVLGYDDNVRTFNLMAPAIAQLQVGAAGMVSIPDGAAFEPANGPVWRQLELRINGRPTREIKLDVAVVGGTATEGSDFTISKSVTFSGGLRQATLGMTLYPDDEVEGSETIELSISSPDLTTEIARSTATFTIIEPERREISGRIAFPAGSPAPTTPLAVRFENVEGDGSNTEMTLQPPNFGYRFKVPYGVQVELIPDWLPAPFVLRSATFHPEVRADSEVAWFPEVGMRVSGRVRAKAGMPQAYVGYIDTTMFDDTTVMEGRIYVSSGPDYAFEQYVPRGWNLRLAADPGAPFMPGGDAHWNVTSNVTRDLVFGDQPLLYAWAGAVNPGQSITGAVWLEGVAPAGGVRFRCRTVDDTAKAGSDYTAHESFGLIPAGESGFGYCGTIQALPNVSGERAETFKLQIDQVTGAAASNPIAPIRINGPKFQAR